MFLIGLVFLCVSGIVTVTVTQGQVTSLSVGTLNDDCNTINWSNDGDLTIEQDGYCFRGPYGDLNTRSYFRATENLNVAVSFRLWLICHLEDKITVTIRMDGNDLNSKEYRRYYGGSCSPYPAATEADSSFLDDISCIDDYNYRCYTDYSYELLVPKNKNFSVRLYADVTSGPDNEVWGFALFSITSTLHTSPTTAPPTALPTTTKSPTTTTTKSPTTAPIKSPTAMPVLPSSPVPSPVSSPVSSPASSPVSSPASSPVSSPVSSSTAIDSSTTAGAALDSKTASNASERLSSTAAILVALVVVLTVFVLCLGGCMFLIHIFIVKRMHERYMVMLDENDNNNNSNANTNIHTDTNANTHINTDTNILSTNAVVQSNTNQNTKLSVKADDKANRDLAPSIVLNPGAGKQDLPNHELHTVLAAAFPTNFISETNTEELVLSERDEGIELAQISDPNTNGNVEEYFISEVNEPENNADNIEDDAEGPQITGLD